MKNLRNKHRLGESLSAEYCEQWRSSKARRETKLRRRSRMNSAMRRGQAESVLWIVRLLMMTVAVVVIAFIVTYYSNRDVDSSTVAMNSYLYRLYYSNTIMYADSHTQRVYPGIVDLSKFNSSNLDKTFQERQKSGFGLASKLTLHDGKDLPPIYNDEQSFNELISLPTQGPGGVSTLMETWPVTIKDGNNERQGTLDIVIVRPNT